VNISKKAFMNKTSDIQETADDLNNHPMAAVEDRKTEADEIGWAAQNTLNDGQGEAETGQIDPESKAKTLRSEGGGHVHRQSLSTILLTLVAVLLVGLFFFFARAISFFSGMRRSGNRQRRR
jgi:hypothetical protein